MSKSETLTVPQASRRSGRGLTFWHSRARRLPECEKIDGAWRIPLATYEREMAIYNRRVSERRDNIGRWFSAYASDSQIDALEAKAKELNISRNAALRAALEMYLKEKNEI